MKPYQSNMPPDCTFMILLTAISVITMCLTLVTAFEVRSLHAQYERRSRKAVHKSAHRQARQTARRARRRHADMGTETIQVPSLPNDRGFLSSTSARQHTTNEATGTTVDGASYVGAACSSTGPYPESTSSSCPSALSSSQPSFVDLSALSGRTLPVESSNPSGITLVDTSSSDSEYGQPRSEGARRQLHGTM